MIRVDVLDNMGYIVGAENFYFLESCDSNHCKACSISNCPSTGCYVCSQDNACYPDTTSGRCACGLATDTDNKDYNVKGTCTQTNYLCQKTTYGDYCPLEKDNSLCCKALSGQYWHVNKELGNGDFECCRTEYPMLYGGCLETKNTSCKGVLVEYYAVGKECKSEYHDCSNDGKVCSNGACVAVIPGQTCSDGTSYGICSAIKPKYCNNGNLIDKCTQCGCPSIQNCNTSDSCYTPSGANLLSLQSGWNMVSLPVSTPISASGLQNQCGANTRIWTYNPFSGSYESASDIRPGSGYWVKANSACSVPVTGSTVQSLPDLKAGWNQIGALSATTDFNSVKGSCNVKGGPFKYDPSSGSYVKTTSLETGYGYWLNVGNDCKLGEGTTPTIYNNITVTVKGTVTDNRNRPLGNAMIVVFQDFVHKQAQTTTTDSSGLYSTTAELATDGTNVWVSISASPPNNNYFSDSNSGWYLPSGNVVTINFALREKTRLAPDARVIGKVVDQNNNPIENAMVVITPYFSHTYGTYHLTDSQGNFDYGYSSDYYYVTDTLPTTANVQVSIRKGLYEYTPSITLSKTVTYGSTTDIGTVTLA
jgi:hypothetical protein